ncbi:hypothetical protein [Roseovarius sp. CH_XMU1461]|uniref:hypothetical protein n=1 Tax=Roseovarius sp. CH_XMU1461 TaxID=3107777 RepID=UPI003009A52C
MSENSRATGEVSEGAAKTTDRLRQEIDAGKAGDKQGFPDPAAAPLGTDAEAGGAPPTEAERRMAEAEITERPNADQARPDLRPISPSAEPGPGSRPLAKLALVVGLGLLVIWLVVELV